MKTIHRSNQFVYAFHTDMKKNVPPGKVHVHLVRFETLEMTEEEAEDTDFAILGTRNSQAKMMCAVIN